MNFRLVGATVGDQTTCSPANKLCLRVGASEGTSGVVTARSCHQRICQICEHIPGIVSFFYDFFYDCVMFDEGSGTMSSLVV